jgi:Fe-S-cluster containining protein
LFVPRFDCQDCGACCCNTAKNLADGNRDYIEVTKDDRLYVEERQLLRTLGNRNEAGVWHLQLVDEEQRCVALEGEIGDAVACTIYKLRPRGCKTVEAGDAECLRARRLHGLPLAISEPGEA